MSSPSHENQTRRLLNAEGSLSRAMQGLTTGILLAGAALALDATAFQVGLLAAAPFIGQLAHIPAARLLRDGATCKRIAVRAAFASRLLLIAIAAAVLLPLPVHPMTPVAGLLIAHASLSAISAVAWQTWVRALIPRHELGAFLGNRLARLSVVAIVTIVVGGQALTWWNHVLPGQPRVAFAIMFMIGALVGLIGVWVLARVPEAPAGPATEPREAPSFRRPLGDANYRRVLAFFGAWDFASHFAIPFMAVVLMRRFGYDFNALTLWTGVALVGHLLAYRHWASVTDRYGNKPVLALSSVLFLLALAGWCAAPKVPGLESYGALAGVYGLLGFATGGVELAGHGLVMKLAPDDAAPAYIASANATHALSRGTAPIVGGAVATLFADNAFSMSMSLAQGTARLTLTPLQLMHHDFLFLMSIAMGVLAIRRLLTFTENTESMASPDEVPVLRRTERITAYPRRSGGLSARPLLRR